MVLAGAGAIVASGGAAHADDQVVGLTCSMTTAMAGTLTSTMTLTLGVNAPSAAAPGSTITVGVSANPEVLPNSDANPQDLVAYQNLQTTYAVSGGTVVAGSEQITSGATIKTFPIASHIDDASNSVSAVVDGPIPPGTFVPPAFTFQVHVDDAASTVTFIATEHDETVDFDGPGPAESDPMTCPIGVTLATTTVDPNATTTSTSASTSTTATSTSTSTSSSTTSTTTQGSTSTTDPTSTTSTSTSTSTTIDPPPSGWSISNATAIEPAPRHGIKMFFTISRSDTSMPARIKFMTVDGTAVHKVDFTAKASTVKLRNGQASTRIEIPIHNNPLFNGPETFTVVLIDPTTGQMVGIGTGTITSS